jgi:hypothetical protein
VQNREASYTPEAETSLFGRLQQAREQEIVAENEAVVFAVRDWGLGLRALAVEFSSE